MFWLRRRHPSGAPLADRPIRISDRQDQKKDEGHHSQKEIPASSHAASLSEEDFVDEVDRPADQRDIDDRVQDVFLWAFADRRPEISGGAL